MHWTTNCPKSLHRRLVEKLVTLLSERKAEALMDTLAAGLTDVEVETLGETVARDTQRRLSANWLTA